MKTATAKELKTALSNSSQTELLDLCLRLARFKKENKELLTYLLFESDYEAGYIQSIKDEMDEQFEQINTKSYFYIRKSVRKIHNNTKKYIRYSLKKETEVELLLYFCQKLKDFDPPISRSPRLQGVYDRTLLSIKKTIPKLHEDLQYDFNEELEDL
ncbi:MAG: hypothetical protein HRT68_04780 [Flavobacteriaceae bacterium]|nr:hypothetical protein [Flavobacteriaceae bacterium]